MSNNILKYKGYSARVEFEAESCTLYGVIDGIDDLVSFESEDICTIEEEFHNAVNNYLDYCKEVGKIPDKEYSGTFNCRIHPKLHKAISNAAFRENISLNKFVERALENEMSRISTYTNISPIIMSATNHNMAFGKLMSSNTIKNMGIYHNRNDGGYSYAN